MAPSTRNTAACESVKSRSPGFKPAVEAFWCAGEPALRVLAPSLSVPNSRVALSNKPGRALDGDNARLVEIFVCDDRKLCFVSFILFKYDFGTPVLHASERIFMALDEKGAVGASNGLGTYDLRRHPQSLGIPAAVRSRGGNVPADAGIPAGS